MGFHFSLCLPRVSPFPSACHGFPLFPLPAMGFHFSICLPRVSPFPSAWHGFSLFHLPVMGFRFSLCLSWFFDARAEQLNNCNTPKITKSHTVFFQSICFISLFKNEAFLAFGLPWDFRVPLAAPAVVFRNRTRLPWFFGIARACRGFSMLVPSS